MNDLIEQAILPFDYSALNLNIQDVEFLKSKEISMKARTHQVMIENGRDLIESKERIEHGAFETWCKKCLGLNIRLAQQSMQIAREFKNEDYSLLTNINKTSLLLLSSKDVPEAARERVVEVAKDRKPTITETKEIIEKEKQIEAITKKCEELEEKVSILSQPQTYEIIPDLQSILHELMPATIRKFSNWTPESQSDWYSQYMGKKFAENQINEERRKAQIAQEKALKAIEEKESAIAKMSEVTNNPETAQIIANHEIDLKNMRAEYQRKLEEERKQMAQEASKLHARLNKEKIEKAEKDKALAEKREKEMRDKANAAWRHNDELTRENKKLHSQMEVDKPSNIDNARALKLERELKNLDWVFPDIKAESDIAGGEMHETKKVIIEIITRWSSLLKELDGQEIIELQK